MIVDLENLLGEARGRDNEGRDLAELEGENGAEAAGKCSESGGAWQM